MMSDWMIGNFRFFSPLSEWVSSGDENELAERFDMLVSRVKYQLRSRAQAEIDELILVIDSIMEDYFSIENEWSRISREHDMESETYDPVYTARNEMFGPVVAGYLNFIDEYNIESVNIDIQPSWAEIFALIALNSLGQALAESELQSSQTRHSVHLKDYMKLNGESYYLFSAYDLMAVSERLANTDKLFSAQTKSADRRKISEKNSENAKIRWEEVNKIKRDFIASWLRLERSGEKKSRNQAAIEFRNKLPFDKHGKKIAKLTLTRALTNYYKTGSSPR